MLNPSDHNLSFFSLAYEWLCKARKNHPPDADIWDFRRMGPYQAETIVSRFADGSYLLDVQKKITLACGDTIAMWSSVDSLVIKCLPEFCRNGFSRFFQKGVIISKGMAD